MGHFAVVGGALVQPSSEELLSLLLDPPTDLQAIAWTAARKRHASLRCGPCQPGLLMVGAEQGTITWDVADGRDLVAAISILRESARQEHILSGQYPPHVILALGSTWEPAEAVVRQWRPSLALNMAVALVRRPDTTTTEAPMPISDPHRRAGELLLVIGTASTLRDQDPIRFWAEHLPRRLAAAGQRSTLIAAVGWLCQQLRVNPSNMADAVEVIEAMTDEQADETLGLWRSCHLLCIAYARQISRERYEERL